jgi:hypothetical protein
MTAHSESHEPHILNPYLGGAICRDADAAYFTDRPPLSRCPACISAWNKHEHRHNLTQGRIPAGRMTE